MPELPVKEIRLPELHLPEIDREQIIAALSGLRRPAVDPSTVERPRSGRLGSDRSAWRAVDWRAIDLGPFVAGATALARVGSRARPLIRSRWAIVAGVAVVAGLATTALIATPAVRERAGRTVRGVRARMDGSPADMLEIDADPTDTKADVETIAEDVVRKTGDVVTTVEDSAETVGTAG